MTERADTSLPPIPTEWQGRYRRYENAAWIGLIDASLDTPEARPWIDTPGLSLGDDTVEQWYKQGRNLLAEVRWPGADASAEAPATAVVKQFGAHNLWGRLRSRFRPNRAVQGWVRAFEILERGFATPRPLWIALPRQGGAGLGAWLTVETAPPHTRLREVLKQLRKGRGRVCLDGKTETFCDGAAFLNALAHWTRRLHDSGIWHRDFSGGNVLIPRGWTPDAPGSAPFVLLDVNRARIGPAGSLTAKQRMQDLERVSLREEDRAPFYAAYAEGDPTLEDAQETYLTAARSYRRLRETRHPLARLWRKVFTYWLR